MYLEDRAESFFVPNKGMDDAVTQALDWKDEHADEMDAGADDGEGWRRARQIKAHHENDEPLAIEYWQEINAFHSRHRAQGNHELDDEFRGEPWRDNGYVSDHTWGSDAGASQAERVVEYVESVDSQEA